MVPPGDESGVDASAVRRRGRRRHALRPRRGRHEGRASPAASRRRSTISPRTAASPKGSISFLITGDEEGVAVNGTVKLLQWAAERGEKFDHCVLGEPSNRATARRHHQDRPARLAERHARGHRQAGPRRLSAPRRQSGARPRHADERADGRAARPRHATHFDPSNLEFTSIDIGNPTVNLIPGEARARFNIRFNDRHSQSQRCSALIEQRAAKAAGERVRWRIDWEPSNADVFLTEPGPFTDLVGGAIKEVTGRTPKLSTTGGTSDARFIKDYCPVVEFGLVGQTMHRSTSARRSPISSRSRRCTGGSRAVFRLNARDLWPGGRGRRADQ